MPEIEPESGKRHPLNMRTTWAVRSRLEDAAIASGRSLAQEVEYRLERSFDRDAIERKLDEILARLHEIGQWPTRGLLDRTGGRTFGYIKTEPACSSDDSSGN